MKNDALYRKSIFWILLGALSLGCFALSVALYSKVFPFIDLNIKLSRQEALQKAQEILKEKNLPPQSSALIQSASFDLDSFTQTFVELTEGTEAFHELVEGDFYFPYKWNVRNFSEGKQKETHLTFTPNGDFYGLHVNLPENEPGEAIQSAKEARTKAEELAAQWGVDLSTFHILENSQHERPSGRIDHSFIYERNENPVGEARFRLQLGLSGDQLTTIYNYVHIPESFSLKYKEMRSFNDMLANIASIAGMVLYIGLGCLVGLFFLLRKRRVEWKAALGFGILISFVQFLEACNQLPLEWMGYDTAIGSSDFLAQVFSRNFGSFLVNTVLVSLSIMAAEGLTRTAFGKFPQFWRSATLHNLATREISGRVLAGYLSIPLFFLYEIGVYGLGNKVLNWWTPSSLYFNPNSLASYFPWFTSLAHSLQAGVWEEVLFRAVPLAGAALLGQRFGRKKIWIASAFVLQALIFAAAHANYPAQPFYARIVELIIPSFFFGWIYLTFGLVPGILLHFGYDVVSFAIPIFTSETAGIGWDRFWVVFLGLIPVWAILFARIRQKGFAHFMSKDRNDGWHAPKKITSHHGAHSELVHHSLPKRWLIGLISGGALLSALLWVGYFEFKADAPPLEVTRNQAIEIAKKELTARGIQLGSQWEILARVQHYIGADDRYIWEKEGSEQYRHLTENYLLPPSWRVRFVRFTGSIEERAEEFSVTIDSQGRVRSFYHDLPETAPGENLTVKKARTRVGEELEVQLERNISSFKELDNSSQKHPNRTDWNFTFSDPEIQLKETEARISIGVAGNEVDSWSRYVRVPEEWSRMNRAKQTAVEIIQRFSGLFFAFVFLAACIGAIVQWSQKQLDQKTFWIVSWSTFGVIFLNFINSIPIRLASFSTAIPKYNQLANMFLFGTLYALFIAVLVGLIFGWARYESQKQSKLSPKLNLALGSGIGIILSTVYLLFHSWLPQVTPQWAMSSGWDYYFPTLAAFETLERFLLNSTFFLGLALILNRITRHWKQGYAKACILLTFVGLSIGGMSAESLSIWGALGGLSITIVYALFFGIIRSNFSLIPLMLGFAAIMMRIRDLQMHWTQTSVFIHTLSIVLVLLASWFIHTRITQKTPSK